VREMPLPTENPREPRSSARPSLWLHALRASVFHGAAGPGQLGWLACLRVLVLTAEDALARNDAAARANVVTELVWFLVESPAEASELHDLANATITAADAGDAAGVRELRGRLAVIASHHRARTLADEGW
jgi:hypothetical protein